MSATPMDNTKMKNFLVTTSLVLAFVLPGNSFAAENPYLGVWRFNEHKSKIPDGVDRNQTISYVQDGDKIRVTMDGTNVDGTPKHSVWVGRFDGRPYPVIGGPTQNTASYRLIDAHSASIRAFKNGTLMWWGTVTISKDGKTRTASLQWIDENGKTRNAKKVYDKR